MNNIIKNIACVLALAAATLPAYGDGGSPAYSTPSLSGAGRPVSSIPLQGSALFPESIDFRYATQTFYVTGFNDGSIQTVSRYGISSVLQPSGTDGRVAALGVKVDAQRGRLWVVDPGTIYTYDLRTNRLLKKTAITDVVSVSSSLINDLVIDRFGNAYVTDSTNAYIYRVDGRTLQASVWLDVSGTVPYGQQNGVPFNLNGIVLTPDQHYLIVGKTNDGSFWRIDTATKAIREISLPAPLTFADGITWGAGKLYVMRNFINTISRVTFSSDYSSATIEAVAANNIEVPTAASFVGGQLYVVNSQFDHYPAFGGDGVPNPPFTLSVVPAGK